MQLARALDGLMADGLVDPLPDGRYPLPGTDLTGPGRPGHVPGRPIPHPRITGTIYGVIRAPWRIRGGRMHSIYRVARIHQANGAAGAGEASRAPGHHPARRTAAADRGPDTTQTGADRGM